MFFERFRSPKKPNAPVSDEDVVARNPLRKIGMAGAAVAIGSALASQESVPNVPQGPPEQVRQMSQDEVVAMQQEPGKPEVTINPKTGETTVRVTRGGGPTGEGTANDPEMAKLREPEMVELDVKPFETVEDPKSPPPPPGITFDQGSPGQA